MTSGVRHPGEAPGVTGPVLAIDTALAACSVALDPGEGQGGPGRPGSGNAAPVWRRLGMERGQAEALMPLVAEVLAESDLAARDLALVAVTLGPGSFTGLRVGVAAARGLALAVGCPVVGVSVCEVLADAVMDSGPEDAAPVLTLIDSRRGDLFAQAFAGRDDLGLPRPLEPITSWTAEETAGCLADEAWAGLGTRVVGDGAARALGRILDPDRDLPDPLRIARLGRGCRRDPTRRDAPVLPLYIRPPDARVAPNGGRLWA